MADLKSTTIIPIAIYCFGLGVYFLSLTANSLMGHTVDLSNADLDIWLPLIVFGFLGVYFIAVGAGVLNVSNWSWKVLFLVWRSVFQAWRHFLSFLLFSYS